MKLLLITFVAVISCVIAAQLPDSATQGPNPQDIATPEPEYIDIDGPLPEGFLASQILPSAPVALQSRSYNSISQPLTRPKYSQPKTAYEIPGHTFNSQSGYSYRRPVNYKRFYRRFY